MPFRGLLDIWGTKMRRHVNSGDGNEETEAKMDWRWQPRSQDMNTLWSLQLELVAVVTFLICPFGVLEFFHLPLEDFQGGWYRMPLSSSHFSWFHR